MAASSFLFAHHGMIPAGPILFLGAGDGIDAGALAQTGRPVSVLEDPSGQRRLGHQCWAAIISLFVEWPAPQRRRLFGQIPNALQPGGIFLMEARALGPGGPLDLDDRRLDPMDVRPELEMLHLARFATSFGPDGVNILQVVGIHPACGGEPVRNPRWVGDGPQGNLPMNPQPGRQDQYGWPFTESLSMSTRHGKDTDIWSSLWTRKPR